MCPGGAVRLSVIRNAADSSRAGIAGKNHLRFLECLGFNTKQDTRCVLLCQTQRNAISSCQQLCFESKNEVKQCFIEHSVLCHSTFSTHCWCDFKICFDFSVQHFVSAFASLLVDLFHCVSQVIDTPLLTAQFDDHFIAAGGGSHNELTPTTVAALSDKVCSPKLGLPFDTPSSRRDNGDQFSGMNDWQ